VGSWGGGLYSGDFALDLRSTIRAVARLPFDAERLTDIICDVESEASRNSDDEDHATFWLVLADQFARRGIAASPAREMALRIIDSGRDVEMQRRLGHHEAGLEKRRRVLVELRERVRSAVATAKRPTLRSPSRS
jgi:hypothetical protein